MPSAIFGKWSSLQLARECFHESISTETISDASERAPHFRDAFGVGARAALVAEAEFHQPDIELGWGRAAFELTTHAASGLTRNDFVMAAKLDRLTET